MAKRRLLRSFSCLLALAAFCQPGTIHRLAAADLVVEGANSPYSFSGTVAYDNVYVGQSGAGVLNQSGGTLGASTGQLFIGANGGSTGTFNLSGGTLNTISTDLADSGTGVFTLSGGGVHNVTGNDSTANGSLDVGFYTGSSGTYNLNGGTLTAGYARGGQGTSVFNFNGGTLTAGASATDFFQNFTHATVGGSSTVSSSSGGATINTNGFDVTVAQGLERTSSLDGGLNKVGAGTLTLAGNNTFTGNIFVSAGTLAVTGSVLGGNGGNLSVSSGGTFSLSGAGNLGFFILRIGNGTFNQSGGTLNLTGNSFLGNSAGTTSTYNLSGTGTANFRNLAVGYNGAATFNQYGGTVSTAGTSNVTIALSDGSSGIYNLVGGVLNTPGVRGGSGTASTFNFNGGTLQPSASGTSFFQGLTTANVQAGGATIDTGANTATVAQNLLHDTTAGASALDRGLTKLGTGTLTLTGANTYTGPTTITAGTLSVGSDANLGAAGGVVNVLGGGTLALTNTAFSTGRTFNLVNSALVPASGGSITYLTGAAVNGGALGAGTHDVRDTSTLNGTRVLGGAAVTIGHDQAAFNDVLLTGNSTLTVPSSTTLNGTGDLTANPLTTLSIAGTANVTGAYLSGAVTVMSTGRLNTSGSATPLYLDGSRGVTINSGGRLVAASGSTIELGGLLINNGLQSGVLHVNLGGVVQGGGTFGSVSLAANSTFNASGTISGGLLVANGATVSLSGSGQALVVNGALTNNGIMRFESGATLTAAGGANNVVNNGTIDIITGGFSVPAGFTNNGIVLDSSVTKVKSIARAADGSAVTLQIDAYPGHSYKLQRSDSLASGSFTDVQNVPVQSNAATNSAPTTLTFTDGAPAAAKGFYRVQVDS